MPQNKDQCILTLGEQNLIPFGQLSVLTQCFALLLEHSVLHPTLRPAICGSSAARPTVSPCPVLVLISLFVFAVGPVPGELLQFQLTVMTRIWYDVRNQLKSQRFLRTRLLAGGFATQFLFAECKA